MSEEINTEVNVQEVLHGGREVEVVFHQKKGKQRIKVKEAVWVKHLSIIEMDKLNLVGTGTAVQVVTACCPDLSIEKLADISVDGFKALHTACLELNLPNFQALLKHEREVEQLPEIIALNKEMLILEESKVEQTLVAIAADPVLAGRMKKLLS